MSTISVVIPATNTPATLARCRAAVAAAADGPDEVVVVEGPQHLSASGARNEGVHRATGDVVVFVDADVEVHADAFTRIRGAFAAHPGLTAVYGAYDDAPEVDTTVSAFRNLLHHHVHHEAAGPAETFWTGLGAVRREAFLATGGFDEDRFPHPSVEDIDLGNRLRADGAEILLDPAIQGTHLKRWTLSSMLWTDFARRGVPWVALQVRAGRPSNSLNCGWRHRVSAVSWAFAVLCVALGTPLLAAASVAGQIGLNRGFYGLLVRRQGMGRAVLGVGLHGLHHLVALAAVPVGIAVGLMALPLWRRLATPDLGAEAAGP
jgi:GT2 family glycosyltransferase